MSREPCNHPPRESEKRDTVRYNFSDGWASLAHFLGKPIPDAPFPHVDLPGVYFEGKDFEPVSFLQESSHLEPGSPEF